MSVSKVGGFSNIGGPRIEVTIAAGVRAEPTTGMVYVASLTGHGSRL